MIFKCRQITEFFCTEKQRTEEAFCVKQFNFFDEVNENSFTVDQSESTFDGYNAAITQLDLSKASETQHKIELKNVRVFDSMSMTSGNTDSKGSHGQQTQESFF